MRNLTRITHACIVALVLLFGSCTSPDTTEDTALVRDRVALDSLGRPSLPEGELVRAQSRESEMFQERIEQAPEIEVTYVEEGSIRGSRIVNEPGYLPDDRTPSQEPAGATDTTVIIPLDPSDEIRPSRAVFGVDDRGVPKLEMPYYLIGRLNIESAERPGMLGGHCTASLVGPRHILTASYCFKEDEQDKRLRISPWMSRGSNPRSVAPKWPIPDCV